MKTIAQAHDFENKLASVGARLDELMERARVGEKTEQLRNAIEGEVKRLQREVTSVRSTIDQDLADSREALLDAVRDELNVWKGRLEDLRLQVALGQMEARDRLSPAVRRIETALHEARRAIEAEEQRVDGGIDGGIDETLQKAMSNLRAEIESADELC